jgi:hypothetical protein
MRSGECRTGTSGESMPQDRRHGRKRGTWLRAHGALRAAAGVALFSLATSFSPSGASAQTYGSDNESVWNRFMKSVGVNTAPDPNSDINYTERPPLVVPPRRDLPPPVADPAAPAANWPAGTAKTVKHAKSKTEVIPDTAVQNPNPPFEKKPWYNPAGWFSKEEYGSFAGEPVRQNLTEPPAGYRVPSPEQPYGISPEKKPAKPAAQNAMASPVTQQPAPQPGK